MEQIWWSRDNWCVWIRAINGSLGPGVLDPPISREEAYAEWAARLAWLSRVRLIGRRWFTSASGLTTATTSYDHVWDHGSAADAICRVQKWRRKGRERELPSNSGMTFPFPMTSTRPCSHALAYCCLLPSLSPWRNGGHLGSPRLRSGGWRRTDWHRRRF
jgi:hypothetical protein